MAEERGWNQSVAVSCLHKALRRGDVEYAAYAAAWLLRYKQGGLAAWRRILAVPAEDLCGEGVEKVAAFHHCWLHGFEKDHAYAAIIFLCGLVKGTMPPLRLPGRLTRWADELRSAAEMWVRADSRKPPEYAFDWHTGSGSLDEWWAAVNAVSDPSPWRADAMKWTPLPKKEKGPEDQEALPF